MQKPVVSLVQYEASPESLARALELADAFSELKPHKKVLLKPNLVRWDPNYPLAPYGVYTTSRIVEDMVILLKDFGVDDITIGEGSALGVEKKADLPKGTKLIFGALGYSHLKKKYGVKLLDFFDEPFEAIDVGGYPLNFAKQALETDFLINMPVLKTHSQTVLSLGLKNLKGCIDMKSRMTCHHEVVPLDFFCSRFEKILHPSLTVLDGIYGLEKGPYYLGTAHRMNAIIVSRDPLGVDIMGAKILGYDPAFVEHLALCAQTNNRSLDIHSLKLAGIDPDIMTRPLEYDSGWRLDDTGPLHWDKIGLSGIKMRKYDKTICTGCSNMFNPLLMLLTSSFKGEAFEGIEVLTGKRMTPSSGFRKTILFGNCMIRKNREDPRINEAVYIKGCPVSLEEIIRKLKGIGLQIDMGYLARFRKSIASRYDGDPNFEPSHFFMPGSTGNKHSSKD